MKNSRQLFKLMIAFSIYMMKKYSCSWKFSPLKKTGVILVLLPFDNGHFFPKCVCFGKFECIWSYYYVLLSNEKVFYQNCTGVGRAKMCIE